MSNLEELKNRFLVSESLSETKMLRLLELAVDHCAVDAKGNVEIKNSSLPAKDKLMLVLVARLIAHNLDETISADVTAEELVRNARIASEQVRARTSDLVKDRQIETASRGVYRAMLHRIEPFLRDLKK
jgi:hypothetical protein